MKEVGIRELKDRLSEYIRLVRAGEVVVVTDRGEVVAELRPPSVGGELIEKYPLLADMVRRGLVRLPQVEKRPGIYEPLPSVTPPGLAQRLIDEDRGER
jgi:antitoxin (DNA-binding transcriptional repressor) of toxin-antitoxin stability system